MLDYAVRTAPDLRAALQRLLHAEGTPYTQLVDQVRRELARRYLADERLALGAVAYLLGFSEPSAFHRAF